MWISGNQLNRSTPKGDGRWAMIREVRKPHRQVKRGDRRRAGRRSNDRQVPGVVTARLWPPLPGSSNSNLPTAIVGCAVGDRDSPAGSLLRVALRCRVSLYAARLINSSNLITFDQISIRSSRQSV